MGQLTLETLVEWNHDYNLNFGITDEELEIASEHLKVIDFCQRNAKTPQPGDLVHGLEWGHGHAYECGLIVKIENGVAKVCYYPYVPFICSEFGKISLSVSGGPFTHAHISSFEPIEGMKERLFKDWGRLGPGRNQAFDFPAEVHQWRLSEPISLASDVWGDNSITSIIKGSEFFVKVQVPFSAKVGDDIKVWRKDGSLLNAKHLGMSTKATIEFLEWKEANK